MNKPKIVVVDVYISTYRVPLYRLLSEKYDVTFLLIRNKDVKHYKVAETHGFKCEIFSFVKLGLYAFAWKLVPWLLTHDYDIVISNDPHLFETHVSFLISKLRRKRFILYSENWDVPRHPKSRMLKPLVWMLHRYSDACIAIGSMVERYIYMHGRQRKKGKVFYSRPMNLDYNVENFEENKIKLYARTGNLDSKKIILFFNRIVSYKGLDYLIEAFARLERERDDVYLLVAGSPDTRPDVRNKNYFDDVKKLAAGVKNICFLGFVPENEKGFIISLANVVVHPGTFRDYDYEGWGVSVNEAMMFSKPVIATTAVGASYELIENGMNGFRVGHGSADQLYIAMKRILENEQLEKDMGLKSRKIFDSKMSYDKQVQGYIDAISSVA
jgi:glycosyltransferase involved in cell wall biosynthesis